ncbi:MAG TPA: ROK family protein [Verrucomicrobiae bacterium]|jgi:predicted NBD/HSP70 family sugar kinase|nr:ROK family protein [Verrucomicrobiae bacterium]
MLQSRTSAPLDPGFIPAAWHNRNYLQAARASGQAVPVVIALERDNGLISRFATVALPKAEAETLLYVERIVKFMLWARGGWRLTFGGPRALGEALQRTYSRQGARAFDVDLMTRVYERPFEVVVTDAAAVPAEKEMSAKIGGHFDGCRIGFDLGASDYKVAAVKEGEAVYSAEFPWNPKDEPDPTYHYERLTSGLRAAASHLPRVDAIGGSSAGVIVDNEIKVGSLIRAVTPDKLAAARGLFHRLEQDWKAPVVVVNDGDVTALAGAISLKKNGLLGIALGSSQAAGYLNPNGGMTGWLSEFAFAPVDYNPAAPADEWSRDIGVGALYFSQQAVNKLLPAAGLSFPAELGLPERLKEVQALMTQGDPRAARIYETIGVYLGWSVPHYADFYEFSDALILGRVTTGRGGEILLDTARATLRREFPELAERVQLHLPDEKSRRVGQAVAAASLPALGR